MVNKIYREDLFAPIILGAIFLISRFLYHMAGIRFRSDTIEWVWHFIDIELLKTDLWRSIFYLHTQPPLMNLFTGIGIQLFPDSYGAIFQIIYLLGGYLLTLSIYVISIRLGLPKTFSIVLAAWFSVSPATLVYENDYFYTYPTTILLIFSVLFLARFLKYQHALDGIIFSLMLAANALTWGLFHLLWLIVCYGLVFFLLKGNRHKSLWLLPAFLLVFAWYAKNGILYDSFTASSWAGLNLFKTVTLRIPGDAREQWIEDGKISKLALVPPYRSVEVYEKYLPTPPTTGIPLLDDGNTSTGYRNQHHYIYIYAGERYLKDSVRMILLAPRSYLNTIKYSLYIYFHSASDYEPTRGIRVPIDEFDTFWNRLFYGQLQKDESLDERAFTFSPTNLGWLLVLSFGFVVAATPIYLWTYRSDKYTLEYGLVLFMFWNILFVSAAGILLDIGENNRTRFIIDPLIMLTFWFLIHKMLILGNINR